MLRVVIRLSTELLLFLPQKQKQKQSPPPKKPKKQEPESAFPPQKIEEEAKTVKCAQLH